MTHLRKWLTFPCPALNTLLTIGLHNALSFLPILTIRNYNENAVNSSVRFLMERRQLKQRLRLDLPTLADPEVRDLLQESDLFVRSFTGLGFGFGLFSPLDLVRVLSSIAELISQVVLLYTASHIHSSSDLFSFWSSDSSDSSGRAPPPHLPLLGIILLPSLLSLFAACLPRLPFSGWYNGETFTDNALYTPAEAHNQERAERMRSMAHGEPYRAEVALFGLAPWILHQWSEARTKILGLETQNSILSSSLGFSATLRWLLTQTNVSEMLVLLQNVRV